MVVLVLQVVCATYLIIKSTENFSKGRSSSECVLGKVSLFMHLCLNLCFQLSGLIISVSFLDNGMNLSISVMFCHCCNAELNLKSDRLEQKLLASFMIMMCLVTLVQCFAGSDVLRWRSFYETNDNAWKYHYREVFDNGIRETMCCLGRVKYMYVPLMFDLPNYFCLKSDL